MRSTQPRPVRALLALPVLLFAASALAGPVDPNHRLERVGPGATQTASLLHLPGTNRALLVRQDGELRLVTGSGLASETLGRIPTDAGVGCPSHGVLTAIWDPAAPGRALFVTFTNETNGGFTIGRFDLATEAMTDLHRETVAAACTNLGGGLALGDDGTLFVGVGDMGVASRAPSILNNTGKILRMTTGGGFPAAPLATNPIFPNSYVYGTGVRDPVRLATDPATGITWFLDRGNGDNDELNRVLPLAQYGWGPSLTMGYQGIGGLEDPYRVWSPAVGPIGLGAQLGTRLGPDANALIVVSGNGQIERVRPDLTDQRMPDVTLLFTRDASGPQSFSALGLLPDGFAYVPDELGVIHRFIARGGTPTEPAAIDSIVPIWVHKAAGGDLEVGVERTPGAAEFGLYHGNLAALASSGYTHAANPVVFFAPDANESDATTSLFVTPADLSAGGSSVYLLASARRDCIESGLGSGSFAERPVVVTANCGIGILGDGTHLITNVNVVPILTSSSGLNLPRDLEFHPDVPRQLWVVSQRDHSTLICDDPGLPTQRSVVRIGPNGQHFLAQPSALAFGPGTGLFATSHEEDDYTQGPPPGGTPADFMGPTLWLADVALYDAGTASHMDMLHNSPNAMGIAWDSGNAYWVYDGFHNSLTYYDFRVPHEPGGTDHSDGIITRFVEGQLSYVPGGVSHVVVDQATGLVYAADTGNNRIVMLDPATGTAGGNVGPNYDGVIQTRRNGASLTTLVNGADVGLVAPSGLEMRDDLLFVSDNVTSFIYAFRLDGTLVDYLDTGFPSGTLMGMAFDPVDGSLWLVDALNDRILRITAL